MAKKSKLITETPGSVHQSGKDPRDKLYFHNHQLWKQANAKLTTNTQKNRHGNPLDKYGYVLSNWDNKEEEGWVIDEEEPLRNKKHNSMNENINQNDILKIYNKLNKGDLVDIKFNSAVRKGNDYQTLKVTKGKSIVGKSKVERITLQLKDKPQTVKWYLYNRNGISLAKGDMATTIVDMRMHTNSVNEAFDTPTVIQDLQWIIDNHQSKSVKDTKLNKMVRVDVQSAMIMAKVYDSINRMNQLKFTNSGVVMMAKVAWKISKK